MESLDIFILENIFSQIDDLSGIVGTNKKFNAIINKNVALRAKKYKSLACCAKIGDNEVMQYLINVAASKCNCNKNNPWHKNCDLGKIAFVCMECENVICTKYIFDNTIFHPSELVLASMFHYGPEIVECVINKYGWNQIYAQFMVIGGRCDMVLFCHNKNYAFPPGICDIAVRRKRLDLFELLVKLGYFTWDDITLYVMQVDLRYIKILHKYGHIHDNNSNLYYHAALRGNHRCIWFLHKIGIPFPHDACDAAASSDNLECLEYLHTSGAPLDENAMRVAIYNNSKKCVKYLLDNKCPVNYEDRQTILRFAL